MLNLKFAPSAHLLLPSLIDDIRSVWKDPFLSPLFVVPNPATGKWLKLRLAENMGCVVNPQIRSFESVLWNALCPEPDMVFLHKEKFQQVICALLSDTLLEKEVFRPLKSYLRNQGAVDPVKRVQLSSEIARLLLEYEYNRPGVWDPDLPPSGGWKVKGIEDTWITSCKLYFADKAGKSESWIRESEAWQQEIYRLLFCKEGLLRSGNNPETPRLLTLPQLYRLRHEPGQKGNGGSFCGDSIFIFMLSKISHFHRNMLLEMSQTRDINVYLLNPCSEFWEDVNTTRGKKGKRRWTFPDKGSNPPIGKLQSDDYNSDRLKFKTSTPDHPLLELWGKSGKENITLWCQAAQYNFDYSFPDNDLQPKNRLQELQNALLMRDGSPMAPLEPGDSSIKILAAPEPGREIEVMRENILNLLRNDSGLRLDDMVIYLPDPAEYLPYIEKVFGAYSHNDPGFIPYTVLGVDSGQSRFAAAIEDLVALCGGDFTRARVFSLLRNETVMASRDISIEELEVWESWTTQLNTFRGFDAQHRKEMGDHEECASDAHTFGLGIARILMGALADEPVQLGFNLSFEDAEPSPFRDFETSDKEMAEHYCSTIEELANSCRRFKKECGKESISKLVDSFISLADSWIYATQTDEIYCRNEFRGALQELKLQESLCGRNTLDFEELKASVLSCLTLELPGSAQAWTGSLTFAPLRSGFVLPHKAVFVAGMGADAFPGINNRSVFNLLSNDRIAGDPDQVCDNRYIFLELICSAGENLFISFPGQDIQKDRILQPSSVVIELASAAGIHLPDPEKGIDDPGVIPLVAHEAVMKNEEQFCWDPSVSRLSVVAMSYTDKKRRKFRLGEQKDTGGKITVTQDKPRVSLDDIAVFIKNPLEYRLKRSLGLRNELVDEISAATDEPLESDYFSLHSLKNQLVKQIIHRAYPVSGEPCRTPEDLACASSELVHQLFTKVCSSGLASEGGFAQKDLLTLQRWAACAAAGIAEISGLYSSYNLHTDTDHNLRNDNALSDFELQDGDCSYRIKINVPVVLCHKNPVEHLVLIKIGSDIGEIFNNIDLWLYSLFFALKGHKKISNILINNDDGTIGQVEWALPQPWTDGKTASQWLSRILFDMTRNNTCEHAPAVWFEKVSKEMDKHGEFDLSGFIRLIKEIAEDESDRDNEHPLYYPSIDAFKLTEAQFPEDDEKIKQIFYRLSPIIRASFAERGEDDSERESSDRILEGSFNE
ncbi:MAG: exodeoxyribonuclease V subunit gamma [Fibrobacter sp.]|nr:exodeoxyribonuclease V subunit gamma [Fibrobacter sp.]